MVTPETIGEALNYATTEQLLRELRHRTSHRFIGGLVTHDTGQQVIAWSPFLTPQEALNLSDWITSSMVNVNQHYSDGQRLRQYGWLVE